MNESTYASARGGDRAGDARGRAEHAWERESAGWHGTFALVLLATFGVTIAQDISPARKAGATALLAAMAAWYAAVGRSAIRRQDGRRSAVYLAGAFACFVPLSALTPAGWIMLLGLCPQSFTALPVRRAVAATVAFGLAAVGFLLYWSGWDPWALLWAAVILLVALALAVVQQNWIGRIIAQSRERAELIQQLEATRAELAEAQRQAGALAERERLASEIHDTLAQGFSSILMLLQAVEPEVGRDPAQVRHHVEVARRTARENLDEARALVAALAPSPLHATSLDEALRRLVDGFGAEARLHAAFRVDGEPRPLPAGVQVVLLRATQEALANVRKHARAKTLDVHLTYGDAAARLAVADDGQGFDPADANGGYGLRGMRGRVEQVGGTVHTESMPAAGTTVTVRVPVGGPA